MCRPPLRVVGWLIVCLAFVALQACGPSESDRERKATETAARAWQARRGAILQYTTTLSTETRGDATTWSTYRGIGAPPPAAPQHPKVLKKPFATRADVIARIGDPDISSDEEYYDRQPELTMYWCMRSFPTYNPSDFVHLLGKPSGYSLRGGMTITSGMVRGFIPVLKAYFGKDGRLRRIWVWDDRGLEMIGRSPDEWHWSS